MNVAATMVNDQYLRRLRNGTFQWLVAELAFLLLLLLLESFCYTFCMAAGAEHRTIKIDCDSGKLFASQCFDEHVLLQAFDAPNTTIVYRAQLPTDGGHCWHTM